MMSVYSRVQNVLFSDNEQHEQEKQSRVWHRFFSRMEQLWVKSFGPLALGGLLACLELMGEKDPAELGGYLPDMPLSHAKHVS